MKEVYKETVYINAIRFLYILLKPAQYELYLKDNTIYLKGELKKYVLIPSNLTKTEIIINTLFTLILVLFSLCYFVNNTYSLGLSFLLLLGSFVILYTSLFFLYFFPKNKEISKKINPTIALIILLLFVIFILTGHLIDCIISAWLGFTFVLFVNSIAIPLAVNINALKLYRIEKKGIYIFLP